MKIIFGKHEYGQVYAWKINGDYVGKIGDYAIVESRNRYSLVEIVAIGITDEEHAKVLANGMPVYKNVIGIIEKGRLERGKECVEPWLVFAPGYCKVQGDKEKRDGETK